MKPIKLALFLTCVSLLYPRLFTQGAFSLKSCLLKAVFRIYFRSFLYPGTSVPVTLHSVHFLKSPGYHCTAEPFGSSLRHEGDISGCCKSSAHVQPHKEPRTCPACSVAVCMRYIQEKPLWSWLCVCCWQCCSTELSCGS